MKFNKNKIALIADLHIGKYGSDDIWYNQIIKFAEWFKKELKKNSIQDIIIAGDVIDERNEISVPTLYYLSKFFEILEDFNIIIIVGNHDCYYNKRFDLHSLEVFRKWKNISIVDNIVTLNDYNKKITLCPWGVELENIPNDNDILIGHFEIKSFKQTINHICESGFSASDLLSKSKIVISGHFHLREDRKYNNGSVLYLGSPFEIDWGDCLSQKGFYILDVPSCKYKFINNDISPKHKKINISEIVSSDKITDLIKNDLKNNIVDIVIDKEIDQEKKDNIISQLHLFKPLKLKTVDNTCLNDTIIENIRVDTSNVNVLDCILQYISSIDYDNKEEITKYITELYQQAILTNNGDFTYE